MKQYSANRARKVVRIFLMTFVLVAGSAGWMTRPVQAAYGGTVRPVSPREIWNARRPPYHSRPVQLRDIIRARTEGRRYYGRQYYQRGPNYSRHSTANRAPAEPARRDVWRLGEPVTVF